MKCDKDVNVRSKHEKQSLNDHISTKMHISNCGRRGSSMVQQRVDSFLNRSENKDLDKFNLHVTIAFIEANIPLSKLDHPSLRNLFENTCKQKLYSRQVLQTKYLPYLFDETLADIRKSVGSSFVYLIIDESPDILQRKVVNVLVGPLNGQYSKPFLLMVKHFDCSVNSQLINQVLMNAAARLWPDEIQFNSIRFLLSFPMQRHI